MVTKVNLDALIQREDFGMESENQVSAGFEKKTSISITDLKENELFRMSLRKPDFQRETSEWDPTRVAALVKTFIDDELIPAIILWRHGEWIFVIDGSHRISALIAWIHDDYGDGEQSRDFFNNVIPPDQARLAKNTRKKVQSTLGSFADHVKALQKPGAYTPEQVARARKLGTLAVQVQWVAGDPSKAEKAFLRINRNAVSIKPQELALIEGRRKAPAIAARAILKCGAGHQYFYSFGEGVQDEIKQVATEVHEMLFTQQHAGKGGAEIALGGSVYAASALRMVFELVRIGMGYPKVLVDDSTGKETVEALKQTRVLLRRLSSSHASSLGLHPAVYFCSWTGKHQPVLLIALSRLIDDWAQRKVLPKFVKRRAVLESFLIERKQLISQVVRKFGAKTSGESNIQEFYADLLSFIGGGSSAEQLVVDLQGMDGGRKYSYLQPSELIGTGKPGKSFGAHLKQGVILKETLKSAPRCKYCFGLIPPLSVSVDHIIPKHQGGSGDASNAQLMHPFCNTGLKSGG